MTLKGVFAKNESGYRLNAIKRRFWSLLILLLSVASIRRKLLKIIDDYRLWYLNDLLEIKLIVYGLSCMLQFSQFVWALSYSVWDVFNNFLLIDAADRSKISSDQKRFFIALSLYPLSFFANTPFKDSFLEVYLELEVFISSKNSPL